MIKKLFGYIFSLVIVVAVSLGSSYTFIQNASQLGATIPTSVANFTTSLASSITSSDTSMTLVTGTDAAGNNLSGYTCFTLDEGTSSEEHVCGTASSTSITSMLRGIDPKDGNLEVTSLKKSHRRGASVKITDYPILGVVTRLLNGQESLPNLLTYTSGTACSVLASNSAICDKAYIDGVAVAGASNANETTKGISELATVAEINAGTGLGGTGARLFINPSYLASSNYASYLPTSGEKAGLAGILASLSATNKLLTISNIWAKDLTSSQKILTVALTASASHDILYRNSSGDYVNLPASQSGGFLMTRGTTSAPIWSRPTIAKGNTTHAVGVGSETITHALGYIPRIVSLNYAQGFTQTFAQGSGQATASTSEQSVYCSGNVNSTAAGCAQSASYILTTLGTDASTVCSQADIQSITSQSFRLYFSTSTTAGNCGGGGNALINWTAQ